MELGELHVVEHLLDEVRDVVFGEHLLAGDGAELTVDAHERWRTHGQQHIAAAVVPCRLHEAVEVGRGQVHGGESTGDQPRLTWAVR